jgi:glycosyltransferase involved in cell wall biosynthesis
VSAVGDRPLRLGVYCDFSYRIDGGAVSAEVAFSRFIEGLAPHCSRLVVIGRLDPGPGAFPHPLEQAEFVGLPYYRSGADFSAVLRAVPASLRRFWRVLDDLDVVWILGPNPPQALLFGLLGRLRRRRVVLGVRQDLPVLIRHRRPQAPVVIATAYALEGAFRLLSRFQPVVVVGPDLARHYRRARSTLSVYVSLLSAADLLAPEDDARRYDGDELVMLSVGRLDPEKNPLLLADVLCRALDNDPRWRLDVCGDGSLAAALGERAVQLGVANRLRLHGHVPVDGPLWGFYRSAHALLHVSMTEGVPQVILEAFASRLPVLATDVGGVGHLVAGRGLLAPPEDPDAAAAGLRRLAADAELRGRLVAAAQQEAAAHTLEIECARIARFLAADS